MSDHIGAAQKIFDGDDAAKSSLEEALDEAGCLYERIGWDPYDCSLELYDVPSDYRLTAAVQRVIHEARFTNAFVNHVDKWETHYAFKPNEVFVQITR